MSVYFENKTTYQVYNNSTKTEVTLNDFRHNKHDNLVQYSNITFTGKAAWLYKMTLEKITFDVYSNVDLEDFEIKIAVSNLAQSDSELTTSNTLTKTVPVNLKANSISSVTLDVNDLFVSETASTTIKLTVDSAYYKGDYKDLGLKFDVLNFKVFGEHKR